MPECAPRTQVGRADLLRALGLGFQGPLTLEENNTGWWGYVPLLDAPVVLPEIPSIPLQLPVSSALPESDMAPETVTRARSALRMPEAWVAERLPSQQRDEDIVSAEDVSVLDPRELRPQDAPRGIWHDLVPLSRLTNPLATQLREPRSGSIDLRQLVRATAGRAWPRRLPRRVRHVWPERLFIVLDVRDELFPYRHDMIRVHALLQRLLPRTQGSFLQGRDGPFGLWRTLGASLTNKVPTALRPRPGDTWLILSDLGLLRPASELAEAWQRWLQSARSCGCACVVLAPVAVEDISSTLAAQARILRWSPDSRFMPERGVPERANGESMTLRALLACLAATTRMDPQLLRALRRSSCDAQNASLEGRLWAHPDVSAFTYASLDNEVRARRLLEFDREAASLRGALSAHVATHHAHWPYGMALVDRMRLLVASAPADPAQWAKVRRDLHGLARNVGAGIGDMAACASAADYIQRCVPQEARLHLGRALDVLAEASGLVMGQRQHWCLIQRGEHVHIAPAGDHGSSGPGVVLCRDLGQAAVGEWVRIALADRPAQYLPLPVEGMLTLPAMETDARIMLGGEETQLQRRQRTRGVWGWQQSDAGVFETLDLPVKDGDVDFPADAWRRTYVHGRGRAGRRPEAGFYYIDRDAHGAFLELQSAELLANGYPGNQPLRFRYLEPATFLQGSPEGIGDDDEHPRHPVTLTQGLWLAETPCTQALWQAVMGENPSHFKYGADAPRRPVENVSLDDVTAFLKRLQALLPPGCEAVLPTESQWEYACRAGTQTQYWWGDEADDRRANWNEQHSGTTPVDRYPPNSWGLYDMHGNVWEWCADGRRDYAAEPARDSEGPGAGEHRVVRGGSWVSQLALARAAYRGWRHRRDAYRLGGFRFALRSPGGPEARPGGPGASRRGGAAGGRTDGG